MRLKNNKPLENYKRVRNRTKLNTNIIINIELAVLTCPLCQNMGGIEPSLLILSCSGLVLPCIKEDPLKLHQILRYAR